MRASAEAKLSASAFWHRSSRPSVCTQALWICLLQPWAVMPLGTTHHPTAAALPLNPARGPAPKVRGPLVTSFWNPQIWGLCIMQGVQDWGPLIQSHTAKLKTHLLKVTISGYWSASAWERSPIHQYQGLRKSRGLKVSQM